MLVVLLSVRLSLPDCLKALRQALLRVLFHKVLLHPILREFRPLLYLLFHSVVQVQVRLEAGLRVAIRLLLISVFKFIDFVERLNALRIRNCITTLL